MLKVLFIGDIVGRIGRRAIAKILPKIKKAEKPDLVIANAENSAHGTGITESVLKELKKAGIDWFTLGDHAFSRLKQAEECFKNDYPLLRPANFPPGVPGSGQRLITINNNTILLVNLIGRVFMDRDYDDPFREIDDILSNLAKKNISAIIVDIHAEATSEKVALKQYLNGKVSALLGSHTHVMTNDCAITSRGTAYITDIGMVGAADGIIGVGKENILRRFKTQIKFPHIIPEKGRAIFNAVMVTINPDTRQAKSIEPIIKYIDIK
jgi:metallophosphoesterase (TIGR00282 family)